MNQRKFEIVEQTLRDRILSGTYKDNDQIPTESELQEEFGVSRITVRKALEELKSAGIIQSTRGRGTIVSYRTGGFSGQLKMAALLSSIRDPFIGRFCQHFEAAAAKQDTFMMLSFDSNKKLCNSTEIYQRFLAAGIRDFVLWPAQGFTNRPLLKRLRGLGVNLVLFDHVMENPYADCVSIDNKHAITTLIRHIRKSGCKTLHYIGYSDSITFAEERLQTYRTLATEKCKESLLGMKDDINTEVQQLVSKLYSDKKMPDAFVCVNSYVARLVAYVLEEKKCRTTTIATVEDMREIPGIPIVRLLHPLPKLAQTAFECLVRQNASDKKWKAGIHRVKGRISTTGTLWGHHI